MELGTAVYTYLWDCPLEQAIEKAARFGFRTLEVMTTPPFLWPAHYGPFERKRLRRQIQQAGVRIFSLNPTFLDLNLISLNPAIRRDSLEEVKETMRLAHDIGAEVVVVSPGRRHPLIPSPMQDAQELALEVIGQCVKLGEELGVTFGLENVPSLFIATGSQQVKMVEQLNSPRCKIVFDVANAYMVEDPTEGLRAVAPHLALVHYSDTHKRAWGHLPVGMGEVDFAACTRTLEAIGYQGPVILETTYPEDPDGGIRSSLEALAGLGLRV